MKCVILAADYKVRMDRISKQVLKAFLPVRGKPVIEHLIGKVQLVDDIDEILIVASSKFYKEFKEWADSYPSVVPLRVIDDGSSTPKDRLGAMKDLAYVCQKEGLDEDLLVIGADNLFSFMLNDFVDFAKSLRPYNIIGTYLLNGKCKPGKFGIVKVGNDKKIVHFTEKPVRLNESRTISMCLYFFPKEKIHLIKEYVERQGSLEAAGDYIQWLTAHDTVYGYPFEGMWVDVGDVDSYAEAVFTF